jgi:NifU-like protein involved in Fe-S cluster formation
MYNETIIYYWKKPFHKYKMEDFNIKYKEENQICWDSLTVYLKIDNNKIKDFSFEWDTSIITTACASVFWESIMWVSLEKVLLSDYNYIIELVWCKISDRRKNASLLCILTVRNAIHLYLKDNIIDEFNNLY